MTTADLPGNGGRVAGALAVLAALVAAIVWLLAGFEAPSFERPAATGAPTAKLAGCSMAPFGPSFQGVSGGPTNIVGRIERHDVLTAFVDVVNPTSTDVEVHLFASFGGAGPVDRTVTVPAGSKQTVPVPAIDATPGLSYGDCEVEARFTP